jgi:hypothetical protein
MYFGLGENVSISKALLEGDRLTTAILEVSPQQARGAQSLRPKLVSMLEQLPRAVDPALCQKNHPIAYE